MRKYYLAAAALLAAAVFAAACRAGGPVVLPAMDKYAGTGFALEYPTGWYKNEVQTNGMTLAFFASSELDAYAMQSMDVQTMVADGRPVAVLMLIPANVAKDIGLDNLEATFSKLAPAEEGKAKILQQGETTMGGAAGKVFSAKGEQSGVGQMGVHMVGVKKEDGSVTLLLGYTLARDIDKNLKIFEQMQKSFEFK